MIWQNCPSSPCCSRFRTPAQPWRLDERIAGSPVGPGWIERSRFADACASLWVDSELVQLEDLVLHDAGADIRAPSHEQTIAHDVLRARGRIASQPLGWALSVDGVRSLRGQAATEAVDDSVVGDKRAGRPDVDSPVATQSSWHCSLVSLRPPNSG